MSLATLLRSAFVAPIVGDVIKDGAVVTEQGKITAVGRYRDLSGDLPSAQIQDLGHSLLTPGLVNAHVHLELSDCTPGERPADGLEGWLTRMLTRTRLDQSELERRSADGCRRGLQQCFRFGVTCVGDISRQPHITRPILAASGLRAVSFGEVMAMAQRRSLLHERLDLASDQRCQTDRLRIGISPHSPYSIEPAGYSACLVRAKELGAPIATHLAETKSEWEFLAHHTGRLKALWDSWLTWDENVPKHAAGPIRMAAEIGLLDYRTILAHLNYASDEELDLLAAGRAAVVYCPRTHDYFGHPPHRFRDMLARGINVCLGTDSCASSPNLNLLDDLRHVHRTYPDFPVDSLWRMATLNPASALAHESAGRLAAGANADLVAFPVSCSDPLREILETQTVPSCVWVAGAVVYPVSHS